MAVETGLMTLHEDELQGILQVLAQIARTSENSKDRLDPGAFQSRLSTLPRRARFTVSQALSALAAQAPSEILGQTDAAEARRAHCRALRSGKLRAGRCEGQHRAADA